MINKKYIHNRLYEMGIFTKKEFFSRLGMQSDTYNKKMAGVSDWKLSELKTMSQVLKCDVQNLIIKEEK